MNLAITLNASLKIIKKFGHGFGIVEKPSMNRIL
jgi:hypothetical protein